MKTRNFFLVLFTLAVSAGYSQVNSLSLNGAIQVALANRYDIKIQKVNTQVTKKQSDEVLSRSLPQITSDLDARFNTQLQTNILPGSIFGPNVPNQDVKLGATYNTTWGFNLNQSIFNPNDLADRKIAKLQTEYQKQNEKITETNIKDEVTEAYFTVLLWKEKVGLSENNVKRADEVYQVTQSQLNMGQATDYDAQRNKIDLENAKETLEQNKRSYELSVNDLLYKMGSDSIKDPVFTDSLSTLMNIYGEVSPNEGTINRTELWQQKIQMDINSQNMWKQRVLWAPTLSLYGNYTLQYLNSDFKPFGTSNWYPFNYLGVKVSFPIFDGLLKTRTRQEYQLRTEASKYQYDKMVADYRQESLSTRTTLNNALSDFDYQKKNLGLIEELYRIDAARLKNGTVKQSDLITTYYTLQQTQNNYLNSAYNYLIALVKYKKAIGGL